MKPGRFTGLVIRALIAAASVLMTVSAWTSGASLQGIERIVVFGDLHGDFTQYRKLLALNGLVDDELTWHGGKTHFVQLGDVPDRGADSLQIIRHLMRIQKAARRSGGAVHALIGNHEAMNILGDLSYVHPGEFAALVTGRSKRLQKDYLRQVYASRLKQQPELAEDRALVMTELRQQYPLGYVEHRVNWQPGGEIAKWVAANPAVLRINRTLFCHGGINPAAEWLPIEEINRSISAALTDSNAPAENLANREDGPLWYRGLAVGDETTLSAAVARMLEYYDVDRIVIAHTPQPGRIVVRFGGKVILTDTGISAFYGGNVVNLVIEGSELYSQTPAGRSRIVTAGSD